MDTPLIEAARHGRLIDVAALLVIGFDVNEPRPDESHVTALYVASMNGHAEVVRTLLDANADVTQPDNDDDSPLAAACRSGHLEIAQLLSCYGERVPYCRGSQRFDIGNPISWDTPLTDAARHGRAADMAALLAGGADVNEQNSDGVSSTPLIIACQEGQTEIVKKLLAAKADVNQARKGGATPLHSACAQGHTEVVTKLIAANADVNHAADDGATPLYVACQQGHPGGGDSEDPERPPTGSCARWPLPGSWANWRAP